jgi:serine/threonine protein kinase
MGKVLAGRYEILKPIAAGGMATVYLGRALGMGGFERLVAIKLMHSHIVAEQEFVTMFLDEARLAARIRHPNVVPTLDVQESQDGLFLIMEYIEGASLHQILRAAGATPGAMPLGIVLRVMLDTLAGLHAAHELVDDEGNPLALVHRDVSPANVLLGTDGVARITDFGVARAEARLSSTRGGQLKGKLPYMPPEQLMNEGIAGAVMWEALIGRRLFQADSDGATLNMIMAGPSATPRQLDPSIPEVVDAACMRALAKSKEQRYATTADFSEALEQAAHTAGVPIASTRVVASFVEGSSAFRKMQPKELAALKKGIVESPTSQPSHPSMPAASPVVEAPKSAPSQITSAGSAVSARAEHLPPKRSGALVIAAVATAVTVLAGGFWFLQRGKDANTAEGSGTTQAPAAQPAETSKATPSTGPPPTPPEVSPAAQSASAEASASADAQAPAVTPPSKPGGAPVPGGKRPTSPTGTPRAPATAYDPDRL